MPHTGKCLKQDMHLQPQPSRPHLRTGLAGGEGRARGGERLSRRLRGGLSSRLLAGLRERLRGLAERRLGL